MQTARNMIMRIPHTSITVYDVLVLHKMLCRTKLDFVTSQCIKLSHSVTLMDGFNLSDLVDDV